MARATAQIRDATKKLFESDRKWGGGGKKAPCQTPKQRLSSQAPPHDHVIEVNRVDVMPAEPPPMPLPQAGARPPQAAAVLAPMQTLVQTVCNVDRTSCSTTAGPLSGDQVGASLLPAGQAQCAASLVQMASQVATPPPAILLDHARRQEERRSVFVPAWAFEKFGGAHLTI